MDSSLFGDAVVGTLLFHVFERKSMAAKIKIESGNQMKMSISICVYIMYETFFKIQIIFNYLLLNYLFFLIYIGNWIFYNYIFAFEFD